MEQLTNILLLLSRVMIASLYLWAGIAKITNYRGTQEYMRSRNFPLIPVMLPVAIAVQILCSVSIIIGFYARLGTVGLIGFTLIAAFKMHDFWNFQGQARTTEQTFFMKDLAILGGLLLLFMVGSGSIGVN
jgi:putative oxidoreductase